MLYKPKRFRHLFRRLKPRLDHRQRRLQPVTLTAIVRRYKRLIGVLKKRFVDHGFPPFSVFTHTALYAGSRSPSASLSHIAH
jgi:hypothetical protein